MAVVVAQVSDLHIKDASSKGALRIQALAGPLGSMRSESEFLLILLTGDIAFSGQENQYVIATQELGQLKRRLIDEWNYADVRIVACPGNHDLNFAAQKSTIRSALLGVLDSSADAAEVVEDLAEVQSEFAAFSDGLDFQLQKLTPLVSVAHAEMGGVRFNLICANTSWSSKIQEQPGSIRMPSSLLPHVSQSGDITFALLHHPLNWYEPQDGKALSDWLDSNADIAFWGHEHREDSFKVSRKRMGSSVQHYLARPLEDETVECGFRCLVVGESGAGVEVSFALKGERFVQSSRETVEIRKNPARQLGQIRFSQNFRAFLTDMGGVFKHPRLERNLSLQDVFIEPSFRFFSASSPELDRVEKSVSFGALLDEIRKNPLTAVFGVEQSGKTTFAKYLVEDARHHGLTPLYFDCARLKSANSGDVTAWMRSCIESQYEGDCIDLVSQVSPENALIVVDNTHEIPGSSSTVSGIIDRLRVLATHSVYLTAQNPAVTILAASHSSGVEVKQWSDAKWYEVLPLSNKSRSALIRRWVSVGRDEFAEAELIESEARRIKVLMDRSMGRSISIKLPFFLLVILQQIDAGLDARTVVRNGTQGHIFEAMISAAIDQHVRSHDVGVVHDFLAQLAFELHGEDSLVIGEDGYRRVVSEFRRDKFIDIQHPSLLNELVASRILHRSASGVAFKYDHFYFYYLARWISFNKESQAASDLLAAFVERIHSESAANVVTFLAHFGNEKWVLSYLMPAAEKLFEASSECKLAEHGALATKYRPLDSGVVLLDGPPSDVTDHLSEVEDQVDIDPPRAELEDAFKYMTAARIIQVLGQIMRSRAGGVDAHSKLAIARTAMSLARRLMTVLYSAAEVSADTIIEHASELFDSDVKSNSREARHQATQLIANVVGGIAKGLVGRAADVIATRDLIPLIESIEEDAVRDKDLDLELITLCARISAEQSYPQDRINSILRRIPESDILSYAALSHSVARMFYLSPPARAVRDSACARLGIRQANIPSREHQAKR